MDRDAVPRERRLLVPRWARNSRHRPRRELRKLLGAERMGASLRLTAACSRTPTTEHAEFLPASSPDDRPHRRGTRRAPCARLPAVYREQPDAAVLRRTPAHTVQLGTGTSRTPRTETFHHTTSFLARCRCRTQRRPCVPFRKVNLREAARRRAASAPARRSPAPGRSRGDRRRRRS